ncbi:1-acyl-sn-glycerol-3-phosphate acyltransferase [Histidinibacterium lentulum]|uniref:Glycerol-3-phosphate acyltransferase n=1 Tax=Histidinibacterium lentulum TaxID=2480588 RepID=A0A3N2R0Z1_9RHOB|nr:1-acyl-sn-glycerol-3-phosphate acyltransferase [Histidinibacterium lentulum]ROU01140.1 glycerol-3-phosphate acyltransferase [Histidinibacterium lentulum]
MTAPVTLPLWLFILILTFAAVTFASHFLFPSVRWFLRRRAERIVAELNKRLTRPIQPFKLAGRYDLIQRLVYDTEVNRAILAHARRNSVREDVAFETARRYAREIVPSFSATAYFGFGTRLARWLARSLYDVRRMQEPASVLKGLPEDATVVFVMNHRSNMDYVLVTYLVSEQTTLAYAVGEWARVWPLSAVFRAMGAYFIRRRHRGTLYRRVLERYVQMATEAGVSQAIFPEGGLSLTGATADPKLGLLTYLSHGEAAGKVVFVPVALAYDRVIEDRVLIRAGEAGERRFGVPITKAVSAVLTHLWQRLTLRFRRFGEAGVSFGTPLVPDEALRTDVTALATELLRRVDATMPALAVPLVARAALGGARGAQLRDAVGEAVADLDARGVPRTPGTAEEITASGLGRLRERRLVAEDGAPVRDGPAILRFYAASIAHHFGEAPEIERHREDIAAAPEPAEQ